MRDQTHPKTSKLGWSGMFVVLFLVVYSIWSAQRILLLEVKLSSDLLHAIDIRAAVEKNEVRREQLRCEFRRHFKLQYGHYSLQLRSAVLGILSILAAIFILFFRAHSKWLLRVLAVAAVVSDVVFYFLYPFQNFPIISLPLLIVAAVWWPLLVFIYERHVFSKTTA